MSRAGHRAVPHTADLRIEAWGPTREACLVEAVTGTVASFAAVVAPEGGAPTRAEWEHRATVAAGSDEDLLVAVLDELVYVVDTTGGVPVDVTVRTSGPGAEVVLAMVGPDRVEQVGAPPKAVSLHELVFERRGDGWWCSVTLDV